MMQVESWEHIPRWWHCPRAPCGTIASRVTTRSTKLVMEDSRMATPGTRLIVVQAHTRARAFHCGVRTKECCFFRDPNARDAVRIIDQAPPRSPPTHPAGHHLPPSSNARTSSSAAAAYARHLSTSVSAPPCRASVRRHRRSLFAIRLIARAANPSWLSCRPRACSLRESRTRVLVQLYPCIIRS